MFGQAGKILGKAVAENGAGQKTARLLSGILSEAEQELKVAHWIGEATAVGEVIDRILAAELGEELALRLLEAARTNAFNSTRSASYWRNSPGTSSISRKMFESGAFLRAAQGNAGLVPLSIAKSLEGRRFASFRALKKRVLGPGR